MAIYSFNSSIVQRSKGQSSLAHSAYIARATLENKETGEVHDFTKAEGLLFSGIFAPANAPDWAHDREKLWSEVEKKESRANAQTGRKIRIGLPNELTDEQRRQLVTDFVRENFMRKGMVADVNIHAPDQGGDERNHHAHILLTMRGFDENGQWSEYKNGGKGEPWNKKAQLETWRENWEKVANRYLERFGHEARIDHRTLEAQGIERKPTVHKGPSATQQEREGLPSIPGTANQKIKAENKRIAELLKEREAVNKELAQIEKEKTAQAKIKEDNERRRQEIEKKKAKAAQKDVLMYENPGMVSQQRDAQRDFKKRNKSLLKRANSPLQRKDKREDELKSASKEITKRQQEEQRSREQEQRQDKGGFARRKDQAEQKREERSARTEQTDRKQYKTPQEKMKEVFETDYSGGKRSRDRDDWERERER